MASVSSSTGCHRAGAIVPGPADDRNRVAEEIDELELPHGSADVVGGLRLAIDVANKPLGKFSRREVIFITDMKRSSWPLASAMAAPECRATPGTTAGSLAELGKVADVVFIDVARHDVDNISVSSLTLGDPLPLVDVNTTVSVVVQNFMASATRSNSRWNCASAGRRSRAKS